MKRICAFLFILVALALVSCNEAKPVTVATTDQQFGGVVVFKGSNDIAQEGAVRLNDTLVERGLYSGGPVYSASLVHEDCEIVVGDTDREASVKAIGKLNNMISIAPDDFHWVFCYRDGRLALVANNALAYEFAIEDLFARYFDGKSLIVPGDMLDGQTVTLAEYEALFTMPRGEGIDENELVNIAPLPDLGVAYEAGQGSYTYVKRDMKIGDFHELRGELEARGFTYYTGNNIGGNVFSTYITKTQIVHLMFFYEEGEIRTSVDPRGEGMDGFSLTGLQNENTYTIKNESTMTFVEIENAAWPGGMCMIFKLADGSFFVIDSGVGGRDNNGSSSGWVYATLARLADDPDNIRVSTWLVTHIHSDHAGGLVDLARGWYDTKDGRHDVMPKGAKDKIKIDRIIYNQPADMSKFGRGGWMKEIIEAFDVKNVVKAHPGQEFFIADLTLTVWGSQDIIIEDSDEITNHNEQSIVTKIDFNGKTMLSLADSEHRLNNKLVAVYGELLKSDIIQTAHHGYGNSGAGEVNKLCNPDIVLWPVATYEMEDAHVKTQAINAIFVDKKNYAPHGGNVEFDSNWKPSEPYRVFDDIPECSCGCGRKSSNKI